MDKRKVFFVQDGNKIIVCRSVSEVRRWTGMKKKEIKALKDGQWTNIEH